MNTTPTTTNLIRSLRAITPNRPLQLFEARRLAELYAHKIRISLGATADAFDTDRLGDLPRVSITHDPHLPASGRSHWERSEWMITLNPADSLTRQRFTTAHELHHIITAPLEATIYRTINTRPDAYDTIEQLCDYFAACLLMPKPLVKRRFGQGLQDAEQLAVQFEVSPAAMTRRLREVGLARRDRCASGDTPAPKYIREAA